MSGFYKKVSKFYSCLPMLSFCLWRKIVPGGCLFSLKVFWQKMAECDGLFYAGSANLQPLAVRKSRPLQIGISSRFACRIVFSPQRFLLAAMVVLFYKLGRSSYKLFFMLT